MGDVVRATNELYSKQPFLFFDGGEGKSNNELPYDEWREKAPLLHRQSNDFQTIINATEENLAAMSESEAAAFAILNRALFNHIYINTKGLASSIVRQHRDNGRAALNALDDKFLATDASRIQQHLMDLTTLILQPNQDIDAYIIKARFYTSELQRCGVILTDTGTKVFILKGLPSDYDNVRDNLRSQPELDMGDFTRTLRNRYDHLKSSSSASPSALYTGSSNNSYHGNPKLSAGAGSTGKYCPLHPMAKHDISDCIIINTAKTLLKNKGTKDGAPERANTCPVHPTARHTAEECHTLKQHPHLATALNAVAVTGTPSIRPFAF
jgi:hypothetical protein